MTYVSELLTLIALNLTKNIYASNSREGFLLLDAKWESVGKIVSPNTDIILLQASDVLHWSFLRHSSEV